MVLIYEELERNKASNRASKASSNVVYNYDKGRDGQQGRKDL